MPVLTNAGGRWEFATPPKSIGRMMANHGQFLVLVRAWAYILLHGPQGLREIAEYAIINANYLQARLKGSYSIPYGDKHCMHEFVASAACFLDHDVHAKDIAKALLNDGYHAPTMYFPLIVPEALMIEPTEDESQETLDAFAEAMQRYAKLARENPGELKALRNLLVKHLDETYAARNINVRWEPAAGSLKSEV
jgi:glycine dehydrogenase subunit 2